MVEKGSMSEEPNESILKEEKKTDQFSQSELEFLQGPCCNDLGKDYFDNLVVNRVPYEYDIKLSMEEYALVKYLLIRFLRPLGGLKPDAEFKVWEEVSEPYGEKSLDKWPYEQAKAVLDRLVEQSYRIGELK